MKFKINRSYLSNQINKNLKISSYKNDIPYFNGIYFEVLANKIIITTSDGITSIKNTLNNHFKNIDNYQGSFLVDRKYLSLILKKIDDLEIEIFNIDNSISIKGKNFSSKINCMDKNSYPKNLFHEENWKYIVTINVSDLYESIKRCKFLINRNEKHSALTGINVQSILDRNQLIFSATDSFRIAQVIKSAKIQGYDLNQQLEEFNIIIPFNFIDVLEKLLAENYLNINKNQEIKILFNKNKIQFIQDNIFNAKKENQILLQSNLINDTFPNTIKMIKTQGSKRNSVVVIKKKFLEKVVERVSLLANTFDDNIIKINVDETEMKISSTVTETGQSEEKIMKINKTANSKDTENNYYFKGKPQKISINSNYFLNALKAFSENNKIKLKFFETDQPLILENENDQNHIQLILPIQIY